VRLRVLIKQAFDAELGGEGLYSVVFPPAALLESSGSFEQSGWHVQYRFGSEGDVERCECFASHRMTNDRMYRIDEDGRLEMIGSSTEGVLPDADRAFYEDARQRGFGGFV